MLGELFPWFVPRVQDSLDEIYRRIGNGGPFGRADIAEQVWNEHPAHLQAYRVQIVENFGGPSNQNESNPTREAKQLLLEGELAALARSISAFSIERMRLRNMPGALFIKYYTEHSLKFAETRVDLAEKLDAERFFSFPEAVAEVTLWSSLKTWSLEEAVALSLGKDPRVVNLVSLEHDDVEGPSAFVAEFRRRLMIVKRALPESQSNRPSKILE